MHCCSRDKRYVITLFDIISSNEVVLAIVGQIICEEKSFQGKVKNKNVIELFFKEV
jgi:hypothetical protein